MCWSVSVLSVLCCVGSCLCKYKVYSPHKTTRLRDLDFYFFLNLIYFTFVNSLLLLPTIHMINVWCIFSPNSHVHILSHKISTPIKLFYWVTFSEYEKLILNRDGRTNRGADTFLDKKKKHRKNASLDVKMTGQKLCFYWKKKRKGQRLFHPLPPHERIDILA